MKRVAGLPWFTLGVGTLVLALGFSPAWSAALQLDRTTLDHHEFWRLPGGHLTHWSAAHLACELAAFLACGWFIERVSRARMIATTVASMLVVSIAVLAFAPQIETYRGLSGIVAALFAVSAAELLRRATRMRSRSGTMLATMAITALVTKTVIELVVARAPFDATSADSAPVPIAHLAGIVMGLCIALVSYGESRAAHETEAHSM